MIRAPLARAVLPLAALAAAVASVTLAGEPASVTVTTLDGDDSAGDLLRLDEHAVTLSGSDPIPLDRVLKISAAPTESGDSLRAGEVRLIDGSRLPHEAVVLVGDSVAVTLPASLVGESAQPLRVATSAVQAIRLRQAGEHQEEWKTLAETPTDTDLVVVYRDGGKSIRPAACTVERVTADAVHVRLGGEAIPVPSKKVLGVVLTNDRRSATSDGLAVIDGGFGRLMVSTVSDTEDDWLRVASPLGFSLRIRLAGVSSIDFSASRVRWLGDLPLVRHSWRPAFGFPSALLPEDRPPGLIIDRAFDGQPLRIVDAENYPRPGSVQRFDRGVAMRSEGEAVYQLPAGFPRFQAVAGIDPETAREGSVLLRLYADGRLVYEHTVDGTGAVPVEADLGDAATLRVVVGYGDNLDLGDNLHLGDARVTK